MREKRGPCRGRDARLSLSLSLFLIFSLFLARETPRRTAVASETARQPPKQRRVTESDPDASLRLAVDNCSRAQLFRKYDAIFAVTTGRPSTTNLRRRGR